jgi:hypothetical protein
VVARRETLTRLRIGSAPMIDGNFSEMFGCLRKEHRASGLNPEKKEEQKIFYQYGLSV